MLRRDIVAILALARRQLIYRSYMSARERKKKNGASTFQALPERLRRGPINWCCANVNNNAA